MRILMVTRHPWDRRLGASRVQIELGELFSEAGHHVQKLSAEDVFPHAPRNAIAALLRRDFSRAARTHLRRLAPGFDVIDAQHGDIPYPKRDVRFNGLLVARSCGLFGLYREAEDRLASRWPDDARGHPLAEPLRARWRKRYFQAQRDSVLRADLVNVLSEDERDWLSEHMQLEHKTVVFPNGARSAYLDALGQVPTGDEPVIAFVGSWTLRKGVRDLPEVMRHVWSAVPAARLRLLGTGAEEARVRADLGLGDDPRLEVVATYGQGELPGLLVGVRSAVLPSYVEGFPLTVLELAAAGVPTVAYDVPGPRILLRQIDSSLLAGPGDERALAGNVVRTLRAPGAVRSRWQTAARAAARQYTWETIAKAHLARYELELERIRNRER